MKTVVENGSKEQNHDRETSRIQERTIKKLSIVQLWGFLESCLLPEELKIIELLYLERQTFKNVAEMTGKTEAEIQTIQKRSLKKLRKKEKLKDYLQ